MALLSVNINKFALLRNARGTNHPDVVNMAKNCIDFGAQGITAHPRPDERHAKFSDLQPISDLISKHSNIEFNIEGYPSKKFIDEVIKVKPDQATLVPDPPDALTSSFGWDCKEFKSLLSDVVKDFQRNNVRTSLFINPSVKTLENLADILPDRVELYTFDFAKDYTKNANEAIRPYVEVARFLLDNISSISLNAGHDLNLDNLDYLLKTIPMIKEVSIGHALVCDAFEYGLKNTIQKYLAITKR
ncbi:MAG: pyridoxine 5'-phosphate synthase [Pelagibacteraceae bacterium]|jgi:pyridoxine 5-phosphate synthase|nr:pyridoxine 5'-phosphate synthase [Pelagibacteraceae bacterium]MDP6784714.1 pyridoxine 5'-phosphate synthase [Alphaproteobacteria bacterium]MBO6467668.1 pyridoxine 5'-phosphate synthase [Pelagibacteraceae bacterium]MBO6469016.1 pyridoxine 5'-phosphate synthase [Pelagibacteraceae bacterium]MBO6469639.1 pyridoxine 5'-phosphate synthase [Pelagibacteraceae bacterium]|tara:strand:- start:163 stop:897 length:735 start_codon:yes stop_codon:yes gene_type:complete